MKLNSLKFYPLLLTPNQILFTRIFIFGGIVIDLTYTLHSDNQEKESYDCAICNTSFSTAKFLCEHLNEKHLREQLKRFSLETIDETRPMYRSDWFEGQSTTEVPTDEFQCEFCGKGEKSYQVCPLTQFYSVCFV